MSEDLHAPPQINSDDNRSTVQPSPPVPKTIVSNSTFFTAGSPFLKHPLLTPERTAHEIDCLLAKTELAPPASILDIGCGFGRHAIELARRGFLITAIDTSSAMIEAAVERAARETISVDFRIGDGRTFQGDVVYDAAISLFTTVGQIEDDTDNVALVANLYGLLRPGGHFIVEVPQRSVALANMREEENIEGPQSLTHIVRRFDSDANIMNEHFEVVSARETRTFVLRYRLFDPDELQAIFHQAGFHIEAVHNGFTGKPLHPDSATMVLWCRRPFV